MTFKCCECGHIFESGEEAVWYETHGLEHPPYEEWRGCPICNGSYEETIQCAICGSEHLEDELIGGRGGVCEECIGTYRYDVNMCYRIGERDKKEVELNGLFASLYSTEEIESLIWNDILNTQKTRSVDCTPFIEEDDEWFANELAKEVNKDENC